MAIELIYCADGNARFAEIAIEAGYTYGAQLPNTVYYRPEFVDQNWKAPDLSSYLAAIAEHKPRMATVLDWEHEDQLPDVLGWAEEIAPYVEIVIIIPKVIGGISVLPRMIGGKPVRLGYSVPTKFGGTSVPVWEFGDWPVHLLGGSPHKQSELARYMDVVSADGNMAHKMATRFCAFYDQQKRTKRGHWAHICEFDGERWGDDAPYEAFRRSCENIMAMWKDE